MAKLKVGDNAPAISLLDQGGNMHKLSDYKGKWVLVYFYPKDNTPGCTLEAKAMRDEENAFKRKDIVVLGISPDTVMSHGNFADKYDLSFTLLADTEKKTVKDYGVWGKKKFMGREYMGVLRMSFLIDPKGKIAKIYDKVKPAEHANQVLCDADLLKK